MSKMSSVRGNMFEEVLGAGEDRFESQMTGWKDAGDVFDFVSLFRDVFVLSSAPKNGWTLYKVHKEVFNRLKHNSGRQIRCEAEYKRVWNILAKCYLEERQFLDAAIVSALEQIEEHSKKNERIADIINVDKINYWECESWMFPKKSRSFFFEQTEASKKSEVEVESIFDQYTFVNAPLIVANSPLPSHMDEIWKMSGKKFCADGGANRLYSYLKASGYKEEDPDYLPDYLIGDLDSVYEEIKASLSKRVCYLPSMDTSAGCKVIHISDQDSTDLEKNLLYLDTIVPVEAHRNIMITGCRGGNIGQEFANYHSCWMHAHKQIAFISEESLALFLAPGKHVIKCAPGLKCSFIPLGEPCESTTTTGLKWDVTDALLQFGVLISSSNVTMASTVTIENTHPLIWTFDCA